MLGTLVFIVAYFAIPMESQVFLPGIGKANLSNVVLGVSLVWDCSGSVSARSTGPRRLMPDAEVVEERHPLRSADESRRGFVKIDDDGTEAQLDRRR